MADEIINGEAVEHADSADLTVLSNLDTIVDVANRAETYIEAMKKVKSIVFKITNARDWIDEQGKPYLQVSGAEKVGAVFRIGWSFPEDAKFEQLDDGHFMYTVKGVFSMGNVKIEAYGTRSSSDPFFGRKRGEDVPPSEIDRASVKKSAITNCIGNGITRILGIRNLTWEELNASGINADSSGKVERKTMDTDTKGKLDELIEMLMEMAGQDKDKCADLLEQYTAWTNKKGEEVKGRRSFTALTAKQIPITLKKVKQDYDEFVDSMGGEGEKPKGAKESSLSPDEQANLDKELGGQEALFDE